VTDIKKTRLLIVEDQDEARKLIRISLSGPGYTLHEASTGVEAIAAVMEHSPDVVLLDIKLPGKINGFQVCSDIKNRLGKAGTFVILVSGLNNQESFEEAVLVGANAFFVKPLRLAGLVKMITQRHLLKARFTCVSSLQVLEDRHFYPSIEHALAHEMTTC
jgi:CheY-like chemotaxis protein